MSDVAETLDPLRLPLQGERLIEASAGTGKTFTIAALYLRLLLGLGGSNSEAMMSKNDDKQKQGGITICMQKYRLQER